MSHFTKCEVCGHDVEQSLDEVNLWRIRCPQCKATTAPYADLDDAWEQHDISYAYANYCKEKAEEQNDGPR